MPSHESAQGMSEPIHLSLETLFPRDCPGLWLVVDLPHGIVSCLQTQPSARLLRQEPFSPNALRMVLPLVLFADCCPYASLLAALQVSEQLLFHLLTLPLTDARVQPFFEEAERIAAVLHGVHPGRQRERLLHQLRRVMTATMAGCTRLGFTILSLRRIGYRLQPTILPSGPLTAVREQHVIVPVAGGESSVEVQSRLAKAKEGSYA